MTSDLAETARLVRRAVLTREREGRTAKVVVASRTYDTTVEDLWDAVTNPERLPRWFSPVTGELRLGGRYQVEGNAGGTVTDCEPPHRFAATWEFGGGVSWIDVAIAVDPAGGARLTLEHVAYPEEHWDQYGPGAVGIGWDLGLLGLSLYLSSGNAVDKAESEAWSRSADGKAFIRISGDGWYEATVAGGDDSEKARASADRTIAFYTGEG